MEAQHHSITLRRYTWAIVLSGGLLLVCSLIFSQLLAGVSMETFKVSAACAAKKQSAKGFTRLILAVEFATSDCQIAQALHGKEHTPDQMKRLRWHTYFDYLFMVVYSAFLGLLAWVLMLRTGKAFFGVCGVILALAMFVGDAVENLQILSIFSAYLTDPVNVRASYLLLHLFTWLKWGALALMFGVLSLGFFPREGVFAKVVAWLCLGIFVFGGVVFFMDHTAVSLSHRRLANVFLEQNIKLIAVGYTVLWIYSIKRLWRDGNV
ncbi:MAG TPA: hypothetical protein DCE42_17635 [Myxococcales bacterium]|nr:hypothetical protein [Deltaproteobacteria bacterium]MBU48405.1 hypothetical protein [Deltaproteobacteria bacterium]HAA56590.1 hypothetical protein [Myxococcales bacterium]|tara:strand:- start:22817 stop:23611 length:795 start_codon:yes stop_codon:yes gene_type:complete